MRRPNRPPDRTARAGATYGTVEMNRGILAGPNWNDSGRGGNRSH